MLSWTTGPEQAVQVWRNLFYEGVGNDAFCPSSKQEFSSISGYVLSE